MLTHKNNSFGISMYSIIKGKKCSGVIIIN